MINNSTSNDTQHDTKKEENNFIDWLNSKHKERLDKARNRHPFMTTIRTSADNKIISMFAHLPQDKRPLSAFEEDKFNFTQPSFYHKFFYDLENFYNRNKYIIDNIKTKSHSSWNFLKETRNQLMEKINSQFEEIDKNETELRQARMKEIKELKETPNKNFLSKVYLKLNWRLKEKDPLEEIEIANRELSRQLTINRIKNYWKTVCAIKNNYVIEPITIKAKIEAKNYETIFYKFFKISKAKIFGLSYAHVTKTSVKNKFLKFTKFALVCLYLSIIKFRYNLYNKQQILEIQEEERKVDQILQFPFPIINSSVNKNIKGPKLVKISDIYDDKTDEMFFNLFKKEKEIRTKLENNLIEEKDLEDPLTADAFTAFMHWQESGHYFNILKNTLLLTYLVYNIVFKSFMKKQNSIKNTFFKFTLYSLITNEIFQYLSLIVYDGSKNSIATKALDNNQAQIIRYLFYKNNLDKAYELYEH